MIPWWASAVGAVVLVGLLFGGGYFLGAKVDNAEWQDRWTKRDQADRLAYIARDTAVKPVIASEGADYAKTTSTPATGAPVIQLCPSPAPRARRMPATTAPGPAPDDGRGLRAGDQGQPATWDSTPTVTVGKRANARVASLKAYIRDVCLRGPPPE